MHIYMYEIYIFSYPRAKKIGDINMLTAQVSYSRQFFWGLLGSRNFSMQVCSVSGYTPIQHLVLFKCILPSASVPLYLHSVSNSFSLLG